jgi:hypothetical protein
MKQFETEKEMVHWLLRCGDGDTDPALVLPYLEIEQGKYYNDRKFVFEAQIGSNIYAKLKKKIYIKKFPTNDVWIEVDCSIGCRIKTRYQQTEYVMEKLWEYGYSLQRDML